MTSMNKNPFQITTPEDLTAEDAVKLFVDVFTDFTQITDPGHLFLKGPRGVGKSMMFRYLQPDCQCIVLSKKLCELDYIGIYIPLKNTNLALTELRRFENKHASAIINEHFMVTYCIMHVLDTLCNEQLYSDIKDCTQLLNYYKHDFVTLLELENLLDESSENTIISLLNLMREQIKGVYRQTVNYIKKNAFCSNINPYTGHLYDFIDYLVPFLSALSNTLSNKSATFYLLLDDAHFLTDTQTKILNTWVASRTSKKVSLKISTQYNYKTYYTVNGATIDTPHDYVEIDIATIYTEGNKTTKSTYYRRVEGIVEKRMKLFNIETPLKEFFPEDEEQEKEIEKIKEKYIQEFDAGRGRGNARTDDARRYARPDFIKRLAGNSKSSMTYSYAGFDQLVNLSSGVIRYFLQQAHTMFAKAQALLGDNVVSISPSIQNEVVRDAANKFLFDELESYEKEGSEVAYPKEDIKKLFNLVQGLGGLFRKLMLSNRSERRVFSIAFLDGISEEAYHVLEIGVQLGYFHKSTIGKKESGSIGRTRLYVLNRRLAPIWTLDPNGFAGYLFVRNDLILKLINDPFTTLKSVNFDSKEEGIQLNLFGDEKDLLPSEDEDD